MTILDTSERKKKTKLENSVDKGENAGHHYFLLFPQFFLPYDRRI